MGMGFHRQAKVKNMAHALTTLRYRKEGSCMNKKMRNILLTILGVLLVVMLLNFAA